MLDYTINALAWTLPATLACGLYYVAFLLETRASPQSRRAISNWIESGSRAPCAFEKAIIEIFDCVYTQPLLRPRGLLRSLSISTFVMIAFIVYVPTTLDSRLRGQLDVDDAIIRILTMTMSNTLLCYLTLFLIRRWFLRYGHRPMISLVGGSVVGAVGVAICTLVLIGLNYGVETGKIFAAAWNADRNLKRYDYALLANLTSGIFEMIKLAIPALLFFLWFLLIAASAIGARILNIIFQRIEVARWFIDRQDTRPYLAIGMVAATIVFVGLLSYQLSGGFGIRDSRAPVAPSNARSVETLGRFTLGGMS